MCLYAGPKELAALVYQQGDAGEQLRVGAVQIEGSPESVETFTRCFSLPHSPMEGSA